MPTDQNGGGYRPILSRFDATMLVVGSIIGAGVFFTPNDIAQVVQKPWEMLAVWVLGGVIALTGALTYAELGALFPEAGGVYVFLREAFGPLAAFLFAWTVLFVIAPGALAIVAGFFAANANTLGPGWSTTVETGLALATVLVLTVVNIRGVRWGSVVQNVVTVAKLGAIALLAVGGLLYSGAALGPLPGAEVPAANPARIALLFAMMPVLFSYGGWQNGTFVAAEVARPQRDVPWSIVGGTIIVVASYLAINAAYLKVLTPEAIASSRTFAVRAAEAALGPFGGLLVTLGILVSTFGICAAILLTNPRVTQAVGEDGLLPARFGRLHPTYRTPAWGIGLLGVWSCGLLLIGGAGQLLDAVVFADWVFFAGTAATLFVFRRRMPDAERPYRCPGYPWIPAVFLVLAVSMAVVSFVKADLTSRILGPGLVAAGVPAYWLLRRRTRS